MMIAWGPVRLSDRLDQAYLLDDLARELGVVKVEASPWLGGGGVGVHSHDEGLLLS